MSAIKENETLVTNLLSHMDFWSEIPDKSTKNGTGCPKNYILAKNKTLCYSLVGGYSYGGYQTFLAEKDEAINVCNLLSNGTIPHRKWLQVKWIIFPRKS